MRKERERERMLRPISVFDSSPHLVLGDGGEGRKKKRKRRTERTRFEDTMKKFHHFQNIGDISGK